MTDMVSTVPAVLDALVAIARAVLPEVQVVDGQPVADELDLLAIGFTGEPGEPAVEAARAPDQVTADPDHEQYTIMCLAEVTSGDLDPKAVRDRVHDHVNRLAAALAADPLLGGLVGRLRLSTTALTQQQSPQGAKASLQFEISVDAWTT